MKSHFIIKIIICYHILFSIASCKNGTPNRSYNASKLNRNVESQKVNDCVLNRTNIDNMDSIYLVQSETSYDSLFVRPDCYHIDLHIYSNVISLDSIFERENKDYKGIYWPGYVEGRTEIKDEILEITLFFINKNTNTSRSTLHQFKFNYNRNKEIVSFLSYSDIEEKDALH